MNKVIKELERRIKLDKKDFEREDCTFYIEIETIPLVENLITEYKKLAKGQQILIKSRKKWKDRYYKEKRKSK